MGLTATKQREMACPTECSQFLYTIPLQTHASLLTLPPTHTTSWADMVNGKFISATTLPVMTRHHGTDTAKLPNTLPMQGTGPKCMKRTTTNHAMMVTPHSVTATIPDVMATFPHLKMMQANIANKVGTGNSMGMNCFFSQFCVPLSSQYPNTFWSTVFQATRDAEMHTQNGNMNKVLTLIKALFGRRPHDEISDTQVEYNATHDEELYRNWRNVYISLGHSTLHNCVHNPQEHGIKYDGLVYSDTLAKVPRAEVMADMWSVLCGSMSSATQ